jgi:MYXO-CTERM domain-containing protein
MCPRGQECNLGHCAIPVPHDAGPRMDAGTDAAVDAGPVDAGMDSAVVMIPDGGNDASHGPPPPGGNPRDCGCSAGGASERPWGAMLAMVGLAFVVARRRVRK